jgi:hypothetical protein
MTLSDDELPFPRSHLQCLGRILARPYFTRLWILQEVVVAKDVIAMVGTSRICWKGLATASLMLSRSVFLRDEFHHVGLIKSICDDWKMPLRKRPFELLEILETTSGFQTSDERDRIMALIGIANDCRDLEFQPNYSISAYDFFMDFTKAYTKVLRPENSNPVPTMSDRSLKFFPKDAIQILREQRCICDGEEAQLVLQASLKEANAVLKVIKARLAEIPESSP